MSTILDALKRLDEETHQSSGSRALPTAMKGRVRAAGENVPKGRRRLWVSIVAIVIGTAIFGIYRWSDTKAVTRNDSNPASAAIAKNPNTSKETASNASLVAEVPPESSPTLQQQTDLSKPMRAPSPAPVTSRTPVIAGTNSGAANPTDRQPSPGFPPPANMLPRPSTITAPSPKARDRGLKTKALPPSFETAAIDGKKRPSSTTTDTAASQAKRSFSSLKTPAPQPVRVKDPYDEADTLTGTSLQVQAISWSEQPGKRLTVMDGRILREGDGVGGYQLVQIRPEEVILEKAGRYWKLAFGSR